MMDVTLHVYDVTNSGSEKTNNAIMKISKIFKDGIGLGGIFHRAIHIYGDEEWSFGRCEQGTGVFSCPYGKNPMHTYRERIFLGQTDLSISKVNQILRELSREWPGFTFDLLSRNCNHFCDELCERLGVLKLPGWVNRFANVGGAPIEITGNTAYCLKQDKTEIVSASKVAYRFLAGIATNSDSRVAPDSPNANRSSLRFQVSWFKNLLSTGDKPSTSSVLEELVRQQQQTQEDDGEPLLLPSINHHDA